MKKLKHLDLIKSIASSVCLLGASAGIVFGISAGMFTVNYLDLNNAEARFQAALNHSYSDQDIISKWNMPTFAEKRKSEVPTTEDITTAQWKTFHQLRKTWPKYNPDYDPATPEKPDDLGSNLPKDDPKFNPETHGKMRKEFVSLVLDGSSHEALDRSFNQGIFQGFLNFTKNTDNAKIEKDTDIQVYKPIQDTNTYFQQAYLAAADYQDNPNCKVLGLGGFVHVAPLTSMGHLDDEGKDATYLFDYGNNSVLDRTCLVLIDGNIPDNQDVASVLFRSDQGAFLSGVSTCMYFIDNLRMYHEEGKYQDLSVGVYGGQPFSTVTIYMGGFQRGIEFFNEFVLRKSFLYHLRDALDNKKTIEGDWEKIFSNSKYKDKLQAWWDNPTSLENTEKDKLINPITYRGDLYDEFSVKMLKLGDFNTHFTGSFAAGDAIGITKQMLNRGVSAILPVAGSQTIDSCQEVFNQNSKCIVIGVDSAMEDSDNQKKFASDYKDESVAPDGSTSSQENNIIKFSAIKDMTSVIDKISRLCMKNKNWDVTAKDSEGRLLPYPDPDSAVCNAGFQTCANIQNGLVSVTWDGWYHLMQALLNIEGFKDAWKQTVDEYYNSQGWKPEGDLYENLTHVYGESEWTPPAGATGLLTFKRYKDDEKTQMTDLYANYSVAISILGRFMSTVKITIPKEITLVLPKEGHEGEWIPEIAAEDQEGTMLDWLKYNMYYIA